MPNTTVGSAYKQTAVADFRKAFELDGTMRQRFDSATGRLRAIAEDKDFVKLVLQ